MQMMSSIRNVYLNYDKRREWLLIELFDGHIFTSIRLAYFPDAYLKAVLIICILIKEASSLTCKSWKTTPSHHNYILEYVFSFWFFRLFDRRGKSGVDVSAKIILMAEVPEGLPKRWHHRPKKWPFGKCGGGNWIQETQVLLLIILSGWLIDFCVDDLFGYRENIDYIRIIFCPRTTWSWYQCTQLAIQYF